MIAGILGIAEQEVLTACVKRGRSEDPEAAGDAGAGARVHPEGETNSALMDRLLEDPQKLSCPVTHALMEDPVVAEDGFTYEREVIESTLKIRAKSPTSNEAIGPKLVPNHGLRSDIVEFRERVVQEILLVAPSLPSGDAAKLLRRAEDFVRPKLPDASSKEKLILILKLRARLPAASRGSAAKDLAELIFGTTELDRSAELLDCFEEFWVASALPSFGTEVVEMLFKAATDTNRPVAVQVALGRDLARRIAQADLDVLAKRLWSVVSRLSDIDDEWVDAAAAVLARWSHEVQVQLSEVRKEVLERTVEFLEDPGRLQDKAKELFEADFTSGACDKQNETLACVLLALAGLQADDEAACLLLVRGRDADKSNSGVRKQLLELLSSMARQGNQVDETLLITCSMEEGVPMPANVLSCLRLSVEELSQVPAEGLIAVAEQLHALGRSKDGACLAVKAAKAHEAAGDHTAAGTAFCAAYNMDATNLSASRGVVTLAGVLVDRCNRLEQKVDHLDKNYAESANNCAESTKEINKLVEQCSHFKKELDTAQELLKAKSHPKKVEWNVQSLPASDEKHESPKFMVLGGISAHLVFYPKGIATGKGTHCSAFLQLGADLFMDFSLSVDDQPSTRTDRNFKKGEDWGWPQYAPIKDKYSKVVCTVHQVALAEGPLRIEFGL
mmetsp:Transcript_135545/g.433611  ORF Transcript_135545/g.433611 Transcript_135545/m.433611 type:complete len:673 (-) Transcript_135545:229-2247(-)